MAQIWIKGKPVVVQSEDELLSLLALADDAPPQPIDKRPDLKPGPSITTDSGPKRQPATAPVNRCMGQYASMDQQKQALLRVLATSPKKRIPQADLCQQLNIEVRKLAGVISSFTKKYGRETFLTVDVERAGRHDRAHYYRLSAAATIAAREERWAG